MSSIGGVHLGMRLVLNRHCEFESCTDYDFRLG